MRAAVIGCGAISDIYLTNMIHKYSNLEVVSCCANHFENAQKKAEKYGICACTLEEILADKTTEMVVVLTPAPTHYELIRQALLAGKHVYTEKTLTDNLEDAKKLLRLADERNLYLGAAPETFLGSCFQTARKAMDDGLIGEVTSFQISANRDITMLASRFKFLRMPGGGICYDYGVYYLTALISLLGPIAKVFAIVGNRQVERRNSFPESPEYGQTYTYDNESQVTAVLQFENGVAGNFALNGESNLTDLGEFVIYGTKGILKLGDANQFGASVTYFPNGDKVEETVLESVSDLSDNCRGIGPAEMARAIELGRKNRASKELACHVLDVICQIMKSGKSGIQEKVTSTCERPAAFDDWNVFLGEGGK